MIRRRWIVGILQLIGVGLMLGTIILPYDLQRGNTWPYYGHGLYIAL
jgi:hypothetical protein